MAELIAAALRPPSLAAIAGAQREGFAILPKQTQHELNFYEAHSRLDRVLSFLQVDLGYSFLEDKQLGQNGSVPLKHEVPPWRNSKKSVKLPQGAPKVMDEEAAIMMQIGPDAAKYAKYPDDLVLVSRFTRLLAERTPSAADKVQSNEFYKTVLQAVRLMHLCGFNYSDVVVTLAYGSTYFRSTFTEIGHIMSSTEAAHVGTLLIFLAHSFVLDETCPLRCWQKHIFRRYCSLTVLDAALFRLFNLRGFHLRLTREEEQHALSALLHTSCGLDGGSAAVGMDMTKGPARAAADTPPPGTVAPSPRDSPGRGRSGATQGPRGRQPKGQRGNPEELPGVVSCKEP
mmetsp:Transcript_48290/g.127528  ORF Transcript_48290/g.127528 Transcript_48290/m.127528 type:complete len:343 (+) Transcript_48290:113-1141(+)